MTGFLLCMAEIQWIKIKTDIFDDEKIKLIERMPEGDTMLVIWLKLLALAGRKNDSGMIYITRDVPYTADTLADVMGRDSRIVSLAMNTFVSFDMIEIVDDFISVVNWEKHQNIEGMEKIKEQNRLRQVKYRENKKIEQRNVTITQHNGTEKNREEKNRIDKNKEKKSRKRSDAFDLSFIESDEWRELWAYWVDNKKSPFGKQEGVKRGYTELRNLSCDNISTARKIVDKSITSNWAGLFAPKDNGGQLKKHTGGEINFEL